MIDLQALETGFARHANMPCRESSVIDIVRHGLIDFGREDNLVATPFVLCQPLSENCLSHPDTETAAILICSVDEVYSSVDRRTQD